MQKRVRGRDRVPTSVPPVCRMFTTCYVCAAPLERNQVLEEMPVGRRLAFNQRTGRLWVVCRQCERWNLSPLEERWEAIEACERLFRDTRLRVSTDNIGLARVRGGLDLVRIGEPQRPEFAGWRYGDQFGRRRKRNAIVAGAAVGTTGLAFVGGAAVGLFTVGTTFQLYLHRQRLTDYLMFGSSTAIVARFTDADGTLRFVERGNARNAALVRMSTDTDAFSLHMPHTRGACIVEGAEAVRLAHTILPVVNKFGGSAAEVQDAVRVVEDAGGAEAALRYIARSRGRLRESSEQKFAAIVEKDLAQAPPFALRGLPVSIRLALEMSLHEDSERRAMDGELAQLESAWRNAEELAGIADSLTEPAQLQARIDAMRRTS